MTKRIFRAGNSGKWLTVACRACAVVDVANRAIRPLSVAMTGALQPSFSPLRQACTVSRIGRAVGRLGYGGLNSMQSMWPTDGSVDS